MTSKIREFRGYRRLKFTAAEQQAIRNAERGFVYRPGEIAQNRPTPQHVRYVALGLSTSERVNEATHCQDPGANRVSLSLREWSRISEV
jgi:hypothetical protein